MRVLLEVVHIAVGLAASLLVGWLAAWSYPLAKNDIWLVTYIAMAAVLLMGIGPLRRAFAVDREKLRRNTATDG